MVPGSVGSFNWMGASGTYFWVDPAEQLVAVKSSTLRPARAALFNAAFRNLTYGAFRVPDQGVTASAEVASITATLAAYRGNLYVLFDELPRHAGAEIRRRLGVNVAIEDGLVKVMSQSRARPPPRPASWQGTSSHISTT